jgi:hypothetical protein
MPSTNSNRASSRPCLADGVATTVTQQLDNMQDMLDSASQIPP